MITSLSATKNPDDSSQQFLPLPTSSTNSSTSPHLPPRKTNLFILKSITIILTLTLLVLVINYYLISNCPPQTNNKLEEDEEGKSLVLQHSSSSTSEVNRYKPISLSVYYEVLCPDSKHFILNQLVPVVKKYGAELVGVKFVPFGKASVRGSKDSGFQFTCQHGPEECHGNKLHSCIASKYNQTISLEIIACSMTNYRLWASTLDSITKVKKYDPATSTSDVMMCENASELMASHGYETLGLKPSASFIPTIGVDGSLDNQRQILRDLDSVVCHNFN